MDITFCPYEIYRSNIKKISNFKQFSSLSFGIAQQLLYYYPKETLPKYKISKKQIEEASYTPADTTVENVEEQCKWVTLYEYADLSGKSLDEINQEVNSGKLGPIQNDPNSGEQLVIYPEQFQSYTLDQLPEVGKKIYQVKLKKQFLVSEEIDPIDNSYFQKNQNKFLKLAHSIGEPKEVSKKADEMLYRSCLILHWSAFEVFLRSTIHELFRRHPTVIASGTRGKNTVSYKDLLDLSEKFSNSETLLYSLVERAIKNKEADETSIHGLIKLLKSDFKLEEDPYKSEYTLNGEKKETDYSDLNMINKIRNALMHDDGKFDSDDSNLLQEYPNIPSTNNQIVMTQQFYEKCALIIDTISYKIASLIEKGKYQI